MGKSGSVIVSVCAGLLLASSHMAWAQPKMAITITAAKEVKETKNGITTTKLVTTKSAASGEILHYTLTYLNKGDEAATQAVVVDPIPAGTVYIANSATGKDAEIEFSADGGKTFAQPVKVSHEYRLSSGKVEKRIATPDDYTHIRWTLRNVPAGAGGTAGFSVKVK
jgi:uncharacterized repeat protein (TIGR01451 family)